MNEDNLYKLIQMNYRMLLVMGYATSVILEMGKFVPEEKKEGVYWVIEAIENVVYLDKSLPPFPQGYS